MDPKLRVVVKMPLTELWNDSGSMKCRRGKSLGKDSISELLLVVPVCFVVADVGKKLRWISESESAGFWMKEVKPHLAEPDARVRLEQFPSEYCYWASEWKLESGSPVVLLEKTH